MEHVIASVVWQGRHRAAGREEKKNIGITVEKNIHAPASERLTIPLNDFKAGLLCEGHNGGTGQYDKEAGKLASALRAFRDKLLGHRVADHETVRSIDGVKLERALLKYAINTSIALGMNNGPLGGPDGESGWPTKELVAFTLGPRREHSNRGLWIAPIDFHLGQEFMPSYVTNPAGYVHVVHFEFWGWQFVLNLDEEPLPQPLGAGRLREHSSEHGLRITLTWPKRISSRF